MSGSFTQRGDVALLDKWTRARLAVECGVDLVVELPFVSAVRSAQFFAQGGVDLLARLGANALAFGAECADLNALTGFARRLDTPEVVAALKDALARGRSYADALTATFCGEDAVIVRQPNNILALEYLRALRRQTLPMAPLLVPRVGAGHRDDQLSGDLASGTAIRRALVDGLDVSEFVPPNVAEALRRYSVGCGWPSLERLLAPLLAVLYRASADELSVIYGVNEGMQHRILRVARDGVDGWASLCARLATRRYPVPRIQRTLLYILTRLTAAQLSPPAAVRPLAFNERGRLLLRTLRGRLVLGHRPLSDVDALATDLAALCYQPRLPAGREFRLHDPRVSVQSPLGGGCA